MGGAIQLDVSALIVSSFYKQEMIGTRCDLGFSVYDKFRCCTIPGLLSSFLYTSNNGVAKDRPGWAWSVQFQGVVTYMPHVEAFATGIKIESSDQSHFLRPIKRSR